MKCRGFASAGGGWGKRRVLWFSLMTTQKCVSSDASVIHIASKAACGEAQPETAGLKSTNSLWRGHSAELTILQHCAEPLMWATVQNNRKVSLRELSKIFQNSSKVLPNSLSKYVRWKENGNRKKKKKSQVTKQVKKSFRKIKIIIK